MTALRPIGIFLRDIRIEHTLFALPFAYVGAVIAAHGIPSWNKLAWITLAVLGARTAAMAANRYLDRDLDARNPRTARRALPSGALAPSVMLWAAGAGVVLLVVSAWMLNPLCVRLLPIAILGVAIYPVCKRITWLVHVVLGAVDGLAPLGAYIGIAATVTPAAILLFAAVTLWVAGFDLLYALMDIPYDREAGVHSLPVRFGEGSAYPLSLLAHTVMLASLFAAGRLAGAGPPYLLGIAAGILLVGYEGWLLARERDVFALNERIFNANMAFSVVFMIATLAAYAGRA